MARNGLCMLDGLTEVLFLMYDIYMTRGFYFQI